LNEVDNNNHAMDGGFYSAIFLFFFLPVDKKNQVDEKKVFFGFASC